VEDPKHVATTAWRDGALDGSVDPEISGASVALVDLVLNHAHPDFYAIVRVDDQGIWYSDADGSVQDAVWRLRLLPWRHIDHITLHKSASCADVGCGRGERGQQQRPRRPGPLCGARRAGGDRSPRSDGRAIDVPEAARRAAEVDRKMQEWLSSCRVALERLGVDWEQFVTAVDRVEQDARDAAQDALARGRHQELIAA
jgi:hypothetical protein